MKLVDMARATPTIDIGILTIRDDEFKAVLAAFPDGHNVYKGRHREYTIRTAKAGGRKHYAVAILKQIEQGNGEAQEAARDLLDDLQPSLLLIVGIAGGLPSEDYTLGDVVLSTRILDFTLEARTFNGDAAYNVGGGPIAKQLASGVANLGARETDLGEWWKNLPTKPPVKYSKGNIYGPLAWQKKVRDSLNVHFGDDAEDRTPLFTAGTIASSDRLVKDPELLIPWAKIARGILAVEMESAGAHRASRDRTPMLSIRGLSDIIGLKRQDAWTKYACASAAAFAAAYLKTQPVEIKPKEVELSTAAIASDGDDVETECLRDGFEESFANLIELRSFPATLYLAPTTIANKKNIWDKINKTTVPGTNDRAANTWTLHENMIYSFTDPRDCQLKTVIDTGAIEQFETREWSDSTDSKRRRLFVQLLNTALKHDLEMQQVRYFRDQDVYAFLGWPDQPPRKLKYTSLRVRSTVTVVAHYERENKEGKISYYQRHGAFQGRFRYLGNKWYLEITPTYRFTYNGKDQVWYYESLLSGIKRLERNRSVLSQLLVWQAVLRAPLTDAQSARLLEFEPLVSMTFPSNVNEETLTALDEVTFPPTFDREIE